MKTNLKNIVFGSLIGSLAILTGCNGGTMNNQNNMNQKQQKDMRSKQNGQMQEDSWDHSGSSYYGNGRNN